MRLATRKDHEKCIEQVVAHIAANLDQPLDLRDLGERAGYSPFHFHRVFQGLLGETVGDLQRRLRMERAALRLRSSEDSITEIAFDAGYATHESFIKAFRTAFGYSPSDFRKKLDYNGLLPTPNGIHYPEATVRFIAFGGTQMKFEIREVPPQKAVGMLHVGPYYMIGGTFQKFVAWAQATGVPMQAAIAMYYNDPETTPPDQLRSHAGAIVPDSFTTTDTGVEMLDVPGGTYAVATHVGTYDGLGAAWQELCGSIIPAQGLQFGAGTPFEKYLNDCSEVGPENAITELWAPIVR